MSRILKKFEGAHKFLPRPILKQETNSSANGIIYFGSTEAVMQESLDELAYLGFPIDAMRIRAFPFNSDVWDFIDQHESIFIVEQNRDAQMKTLVVAEGGINPEKLISVLCFDGAPITAKFISGSIIDALSDKNISKTAEDFK
jgi:2-oxoglutarate ferredoxin oxidoreductase subunit alpha